MLHWKMLTHCWYHTTPNDNRLLMQCCSHELGEARHASQSSRWLKWWSATNRPTLHRSRSQCLSISFLFWSYNSALQRGVLRDRRLCDGSIETLMFVPHVKARQQPKFAHVNNFPSWGTWRPVLAADRAKRPCFKLSPRRRCCWVYSLLGRLFEKVCSKLDLYSA